MRTLLMILSLAAFPLAWLLWRRPSGGVSTRPVTVAEPAPETLEQPGAPPFDLQAHLQEAHGMPLLDFEALNEWADDPSAVARGRRAWLLHLRDWMGPEAQLVESEGAWILSTYPSGEAAALAQFVSATRRRITQLLSGLAHFDRDERVILVAFDTQEHYYAYVANYYPDEGEFAFSGGMFIDAGCPHFVAVRSDLAHLEGTVAHEMAHHSLAHLKLPLWLDEGLAVNTERRLAHRYHSADSALEVLAKHHDFWNAARLQEFWSGVSFHRTDEGNELSYDLARAIVALLARDWDSFTRFARAAKPLDGGGAAARSELGLDLGELAAAAINLKPSEGWAPRPESWTGISRKAVRPPWPSPAGAPCGR
jgi:hypothetical protein